MAMRCVSTLLEAVQPQCLRLTAWSEHGLSKNELRTSEASVCALTLRPVFISNMAGEQFGLLPLRAVPVSSMLPLAVRAFGGILAFFGIFSSKTFEKQSVGPENAKAPSVDCYPNSRHKSNSGKHYAQTNQTQKHHPIAHTTQNEQFNLAKIWVWKFVQSRRWY